MLLIREGIEASSLIPKLIHIRRNFEERRALSFNGETWRRKKFFFLFYRLGFGEKEQ